jgi:pimeloyl-ACP methyl ester carboxylesterase
MKIEKRPLKLPEGRLYVEEYGNHGGPNVILLHGGPGLPGYMRSLGLKLSEHARVSDYYQRGALKSPSSGSCKTSDHVRDLDALVLRHTTDRKPILIGSSWGAILALSYLAAKPGRVSKAIVIGTGPLDSISAKKFSATISARLPFGEFVRAQRFEKLVESRRGSPARQASVYRRWCGVIFPAYNRDARSFDKVHIERPHMKTMLETNADYERRMKSGRLMRDLARISDPVVAFHGDYDPVPWEGILPILVKRIRNCRTHLVRSAGHAPWIEKRPGQFLAALKREIHS